MTPETKHTPGLWVVTALVNEGAGDRSHIYAIDPATKNPAEAVANARLIAAAPETAAERDRLKEINKELLSELKRASELVSAARGIMPAASLMVWGQLIAKIEGGK